MDMEIVKIEITDENSLERASSGFEVLKDFELALVGGGVGDIILG